MSTADDADAGDGTALLRCSNCGFEAPNGDDWDRVDHPPLGTLTQCPDCGSTDVHGR